ncbi:unnamed protein product [Heterobilharzia americana]|nr:unnamed protein product [Heterobilharzia americana]
MCDLLSQPAPSSQQRTGQKLSTRQLSKDQNHSSIMDSTIGITNNTSSSTSTNAATAIASATSNPVEVSNMCTSGTVSNRSNSSLVNNRSLKFKQQQQKSELSTPVDNHLSLYTNVNTATTTSATGTSSICSLGSLNEDYINKLSSTSKEHNHISFNGDIQQKCSSNETIHSSLIDMTTQCSTVDQKGKSMNSLDGIQLPYSNNLNLVKHDQCSMNSLKSPHSPSSPSPSSSPSSSSSSSIPSPSNHNQSSRKADNSQWNTDDTKNIHETKEENITNSCNIKSSTDMTDATSLIGGNISMNPKSLHHEYKSVKSLDNPNLSSHCSDNDSNLDEEDVEDVDDDDDDDDDTYLTRQDSLSHHYPTSALSSLTSDTLGGCISPMLAAAAMAALTSGCFPTSCNLPNQLNPLLSQSYGLSSYSPNLNLINNSQRVQLAKQQQSFIPSSLNRNSKMNNPPPPHHHQQQNNTSTTNTNMSNFLSTSCNSSDSPMRLTHNSNKFVQDELLDPDYNTTTTTTTTSITTTNNNCDMNTSHTSPPILSRSNSPHQSNRLISSNDMAYMSMDDADEENDDEESEEVEDIEVENPNQGGNHQWTFEEQFKQLYVISDDPKRKEFLDELFVYMQRRGTPVNRIPIMAKQVLDLYELFQLVVARGGLVEVINKKLWREITKGLNLPSSITSAAFTLRTQYMKYLYPYECETLGLSSPSELQAAIDGNRREARRSSYGFDYSMVMAPNVSRSVSPSSTTNPQTTTSNTTTNTESPLTVGASLSNSAYPNSLTVSNGIPSGVNQILSNIPSGTSPFCANSLGFSSQFSQFNPFLAIPSGSLPTAAAAAVGSGLSIQSPSTITSSSQIGNSSVNLFPPGFLPPIVSAAGFPMIPSNFQGFNSTTINNSDDSLITSPSQAIGCTGGILPGVPNGFTDPNAMAAAAAAAATFFSAGFPTLPGAFSTTPPPQSQQQQHQPTATFPVHNSFINAEGSPKFQTMNNIRNQISHSVGVNESNSPSGMRSKNKLLPNDTDDCQFSSSLPLNLTANDSCSTSSMIKLDEKGTPYADNDRTPVIQTDPENFNQIQYDQENGSLKINSNNGYMRKRMKVYLMSSFRCKSNPSSSINKREVLGNNKVQLSQTNLSFDSEDSSMKTAAQMACQQLWAAAAAAAAGLHCGSMKPTETNSYTSMSTNLNGPVKNNPLHSMEYSSNNNNNHNSSSNKPIQHSSYSKAVSKKSSSRTPNHLDVPSSKLPKLSSNNTSNTGGNSNETSGKSYPSSNISKNH